MNIACIIIRPAGNLQNTGVGVTNRTIHGTVKYDPISHYDGPKRVDFSLILCPSCVYIEPYKWD